MRNGENEQKLENINHCVCCVICHYSPVLCAVMSDCVISYIYIVVILFCLVVPQLAYMHTKQFILVIGLVNWTL